MGVKPDIRLEIDLKQPFSNYLNEDGSYRLWEDGTERYWEHGAWTDITADWVGGWDSQQGILGNGPKDLVASPGFINIELNNSAANSAGLLGYYSPDHANRISPNFELGAPVRMYLEDASGEVMQFNGRIADIDPEPGVYGKRTTKVRIVDVMEQISRFKKLKLLQIQENKKSHELIGYIADQLETQAVGRDLATGLEDLDIFLDTITNDAIAALGELRKLGISTGDYLFVTKDGTLKSQTRQDRDSSQASQYTFDDSDIIAMDVSRAEKNVYDRFKGVSYPRNIGTSDEVIFTLNTAIEIPANDSVTRTFKYNDPDSPAVKIGAKDVAAGTWEFGSTEGAGVDDKHADLTVEQLTEGGNAAEYKLTNTSGSAGFFQPGFTLEGKAIRIYNPHEEVINVTDGVRENELQLDYVYQSNQFVASDLLMVAAAKYGAPYTNLRSFTFNASRSAALLSEGLRREIGERITLDPESVTGLGGDYVINGIIKNMKPGRILEVTFIVEKPYDIDTMIYDEGVYDTHVYGF